VTCPLLLNSDCYTLLRCFGKRGVTAMREIVRSITTAAAETNHDNVSVTSGPPLDDGDVASTNIDGGASFGDGAEIVGDGASAAKIDGGASVGDGACAAEIVGDCAPTCNTTILSRL